MIEDAEGTLPVFSYLQIAAGTSQLWRLQTGAYSNADQTKPLNPHSGTKFFLFDSWSGASSVDFVSRFYSNCIKMPSTVAPNPAPVTTISFWMSHDIIYPTDYDSLYLSVSTNKGLSWTRLFPGFRRPGFATDSTPIWKLETVNISAYNGQTIQIGFDGVSKYGNVIGLDDITINYTGVAPVSLLQFDAKRSGPINNLSWNTSQEVNTRGFEIERSTDGKNFVKIGYVTAAGNSNTNRNYFYTDASPSKGINYYRLRMEDNDNAYKYSQIRSVKNLGLAEVTIAPNPVQNTMNLMIDAENTEKSTLVITDIAGKMVYKNSLSVIAGTNTFHIPVSNLTTGTYIVTIQLSGETIIKKINKR
jgi:hypothetical protein